MAFSQRNAWFLKTKRYPVPREHWPITSSSCMERSSSDAKTSHKIIVTGISSLSPKSVFVGSNYSFGFLCIEIIASFRFNIVEISTNLNTATPSKTVISRLFITHTRQNDAKKTKNMTMASSHKVCVRIEVW